MKSLNRKTIIVSFWLLAGLAMFIWPGSAAIAQEVKDVNFVENPNLLAEPRMPGTIEGTGTYFEVNDSNYLNITFESSEPVHLMLQSAPQMVIMDINAAGDATSTQITLGGFAPSTTYYMYEDNYHNKTALTTDANGNYTYVQDLARHHLVFIQPQPSTIFLSDSGWSNPAVGTWDPCTKTGTLTTNVNETIQIDSDSITLDGNGYTVTGTGTGYGVYLYKRKGVTIKNLNVLIFSIGIYLYNSSNNTLTDNTFSNNTNHGIDLWSSKNNKLTGNTVSNNLICGIRLDSSYYNTLTGNTISSNQYGIHLDHSLNNTLTGNTSNSNNYSGINIYFYSNANIVTGNTASNNGIYGISLYYASNNTLTGNTSSSNNNGIGIFLSRSNNNTFTGNTTTSNQNGIHFDNGVGNTLTGNTTSSNNCGIYFNYSNNNTLTGNTSNNNQYGIYFYNSSNTNQIYNNNFINNAKQAYVYISYGNVFNLAKPTGGNFWSNWKTPDSDGDGFVDYPYVFTGGQDNLPWARKDGWLPPVANAGDNIQITSANQAYTIIQGTGTDPAGDPLTYRWLEGETVLLNWTTVSANGEAYLDLGTLPYFSIGNHTLTLEVSDGIFTDSDEMILTVQNSPPEAQPAPAHQVVEIGIDPIVVVADVLDFDGDTLSYQWLKNSEVLASGNVETVQGGEAIHLPDLNIPASDTRFPLGVHTIELKVNDGVNDAVSAYVSVEVSDTTVPSLSPIPSATILWPPNHQLRPVTIYANAFDNGGGTIHLEVTVESSEPPDANGDGSTIPDYYIDSVDDETGTIELRLRSERSGNGDGRTYMIMITATDESGNQSVATVDIFAPHDRRKK